MGVRESKQSCITYEDALKRVSDSEFRRVKEAFKKSAGIGKTQISPNVFQQDVLCEKIPANVADLLYTACGGTAKGISFKDLFCGIVLLTRGTEEEKIRFLWNLYCNDSGTYILKSDYLKAIDLYSTEHISLFGNTDRASFEQFREWIVLHKNSSILSKWILSDMCVSLSSELETPTFYQSLAGVTHLEEKDIGDLEKEFWRLKNSSANGQLDLQLLGPLISPPIPKTALDGLFNAFDENRDGHIDFKELCCGVSAACRGPVVERIRFCFKIFDLDRDGVLNYDETMQMIDILIFVAQEHQSNKNFTNVIKKDVINNSLLFFKKNERGEQSSLLPSMKLLDEDNSRNQSISLTQEDFMMWNVESDLDLVQPFLDLTFEVCHIVFGLSPQCKHIEHDIVKGWLAREEKRHYRVGQFWYLISREWWVSWLQYTQGFSSGYCDYCKKCAISAGQKNVLTVVDEAMVCDESFNSSPIEVAGDILPITSDSTSLGSGSSGISNCNNGFHKPGPIDNTCLITANPYKNVRTLTGEGGHLKKDTPLVQNHDFELVPKSLWKALSRWYGDVLPLPRQVIQPPNSTQVELELYPLNLRILLHQNQSANTLSAPSWGAISGGYGVVASGGGYAALSTTSSMLQPPKRYLAYTAAFSRLATIRQIGEFLCEQLRLKYEDVRLWHILNANEGSHILLEEEGMTLKELLIRDNDQILLEIRNKDLTWPEELGSLSLNQNANNDRRLTRCSIQSIHAAGATGLHNLGNTCFMNAALQVLFNTQPLTQYFHRNMHFFEMNTMNKLGTRGQLAMRYGELLKEVWTATSRSVAPLKLRFCVTKHAPQFAGGGQHDSQELLEWLLDALHEDLNRVTEKPYSELKDSNGRPDKVVAAEAWSQHHSRNQSVIIDLFYGQLKSKVSCLCCGRESVRFDPFSLLSLPLPVENYVYFEILVIPLDGTIPVKYGLRLNPDSKYSHLKRKLSLLCDLNPNLMLICELSNSQIKQILRDENKITPSTATNLYVYQLPENCNENYSRTSSTIGVNIEKGLKDIQRSSALIVGTEIPVSITASTPICEPGPECLIQVNHPIFDQNQYQGKNCDMDIAVQKSHNVILDSINEEKVISRSSKKSPELSTSPENSFVTLKCEQKQNTFDDKYLENSLEQEENHNEINLSSTKARERVGCNCQRKSSCSDSFDEDSNCSGNKYHTQMSMGKLGIALTHLTYENFKVGKYIIAVHRKITRQDAYFLSYHKTRPSLFGVPLLIPSCDGGTNKDLYCAVWMQVNRLLSPLPATTDQSNHAADCDDSLGYDFPFTLKAVTKDGLTCALCPWSNFCRGCEIPCNDDFLLKSVSTSNCSTPTLPSKVSSLPNLELKSSAEFTSISANNCNLNLFEHVTIAIDWDPTALHLRYQSTRERLWKQHESIAICRKEQTEPVDLNHCLRAFTSEEKLEEWYYCSHCKGKKPATKKLQIWKLPPVLIIHLKRFNNVNGKWVKSQKVVHFSFEDFDPTPYLASVPQETILRHRELLEIRRSENDVVKKEFMKIDEKNIDNIIGHESDDLYEIVDTNSTRNSENSFKSDDNEEYLFSMENQNKKATDSIAEIESNSNDSKITHGCFINNKRNLKNETRQRLISTSLIKSPIIDCDLEDYHQHKLKSGEDNLDLRYKLYAVVSHSGMLNGGHYISYAANPNGNWYCYNDSSCREIPKQPDIDPSSAYLLFYERQGLDYEPYLPSVEGRSLQNGSEPLNLDESENDLKKLCSIS